MKQQKLIPTVLSFVLVTSYLFPISALAQSATPTLTLKQEREDFKDERREKVKDFRNETKVEREGTRGTIAEQRKTLWTEMKKRQVQMVSTRILTELDLRHNIVLKLKSKIADRLAAKSTNFDTTAASAKLALFSDTKYQTNLTDLKTKMAAITTSTTPKDLLPGIKEAANVVRKDLRDQHLFLVEVMKLVATSPKK